MLNTGQTIDHFKVVKKLGEGGMGEVYLVEDQKLNRQVALKILTAEFFSDVERQKRFQREAKTAAQISHHNIMAIYDIGTSTEPDTGREINYIVMEYIQGEPLANYLQRHPNDVPTVVRLAEKIASGLAAAHKINIVHRDIKAANIMVNEDGEPKILDFGLAKSLDVLQWGEKDDGTETVSQQLTKAGKIIGTVSYMSPEQARGEDVDVRSDIFSFGVLLYKMATGRLPFEDSSPVSTLAKILEARPESPRLKNQNVPAELERIIDECLQKDPGDRYQDTRDLVVDLRNLRRQYDSGPSESLSSVSVVSTETPKVRAFKLGVGSLILLVIALMALVAIVTNWFRTDDGEYIPALRAGENSLAILSFENKTGDPELDWMETGLPEILLTDLAQSQAINLVSRQRLLDYLHREKEGDADSYTHTEMLSAARALGAVNLLSGSLYKLGDKIRIDARLEEVATGKIILGEKVVGKDAFALVDSMTEKIADGLNISELRAATVSVSELTSSSPEAYRLYHDGMKKLELELYEEAIDKFNRALEIDPGFALAYMRIGMANVFRGRPQEGARYFALAQEYKSRLPLREKSLLDIYSGFWLEQRYDESFVRLETFVNHYPDDKEGRTFYALVFVAFAQDTASAFAHLDTVLEIDPQYQLALSFYAQTHQEYGDLEKAVEYVKLIRRYHPESPAPFLRLADLYLRQMKLDDAIDEYTDALSRFPDNPQALRGLSSLYIRKRDFESSRQYLEKFAQRYHNDPYRMEDYYHAHANLANWSGKFRSSLDLRFRALEQAKLTGDSSIIFNALHAISSHYERYDLPDSALFYAREAHRWASPLERLTYPLRLVTIDHNTEAEARPVFKKSLDEFKSRMPSQMWPLLNLVEQLFEAYCQLDTAAIIEAREELAEQQQQEGGGNVRLAGYLRVLSGQYESGNEILQKFVSGRYETTSGFHYPYILYLLGVANEGLGNTEEAIQNYEEMLQYWGNPEIELKEIKDARARLAKLTS